MTTDDTHQTLYSNGEWHAATGEQSIPVHNPATEEELAEIQSASNADIEEALKASRDAQYDWARRPAREHGDLLRDIAGIIASNAEGLAESHPVESEPSLKTVLSVKRTMTATCEQCGTEVERIWKHQTSESTDWLCQECHPQME